MNTNFTKNPIVGTPLTPSVIKQIHTAVRRFMPIAGNGIRTSVTAGGTIISAIPAPASKTQKTKPLPFEVRYDGTLDSEAGGWKIYLPTEHLVQFDGEYLDPLNDVTPILDANGDETGWYSFDEITLQDDHVWLVISESSGSESSGAHTASFANAEDQQAVANICIAEVAYEEPEDEGGSPTVEIKQSDSNTIAEYLMGTAQISGQVWLLVRGQSTGGDPVLGYLPLSAIWGDGTSGGLPLPEVTYLDDVTWDPSNHQLVKHWVTKNIVTGAETPVQGAPQGKTATIATTSISSIIGS